MARGRSVLTILRRNDHTIESVRLASRWRVGDGRTDVMPRHERTGAIDRWIGGAPVHQVRAILHHIGLPTRGRQLDRDASIAFCYGALCSRDFEYLNHDGNRGGDRP